MSVSLVPLAWALFSATLTAIWQRPTTAQILASAGGRHLVLTVWDRLLYACAAVGIDSRSVVALLKALLTPKPPQIPPPPPVPRIEDIPVLHSDPPPSNTNAGHIPSAARLAVFGAVMLASVTLGAAMGCGALSTDVTTYAPSPADEEAFVEYTTAEESCVLTDASHADKVACVQAVKCAHRRAEAGTCDAGNTAHAAYTSSTFSIGADR